MEFFEVFILNNRISFENWLQFINKIKQYEKEFKIEIVFDINQIAIYLYSKKDLSPLATKIEGFLLKPTNRQIESINKEVKSLKIKIPTDKNILELKEKLEIKKI